MVNTWSTLSLLETEDLSNYYKLGLNLYSSVLVVVGNGFGQSGVENYDWNWMRLGFGTLVSSHHSNRITSLDITIPRHSDDPILNHSTKSTMIIQYRRLGVIG